MLNRLYIVIGVLAILVLGAAFIVPRLIPWGDYRGRMEALASGALGTEVRINGDIRFALLPEPHLVLNEVSIGPKGKPVAAVKSADADFSLMDFLRDRYTMTKLVLDHPVIEVRIGEDGTVDTGLKPASAGASTSLSVANAAVEVGTLRIADARTGRDYLIEGIDGELTIGALRGPFGFIGGGSYGEQHFGVRLTSALLDEKGATQVSLLLAPDGNRYSISIAGALDTSGVPHFTGDFTYRQAPPLGKDANGVIGDLTFTSKLDATLQQALLPSFTLIPDENRGVVRLTGSGSIQLGATPSFTATVASGVWALPPRDATTEKGPQPYELVRMLGEIPALPVPPIAGRLTATVDELDLRSFTLRKVSLDAEADKDGWAIKNFSGQLPGNGMLKVAGELGASDGRPSFAGTLTVGADRLDALAALWRKPPPGNPLFNMPGSFASKVSLLGQTMALTDGKLTLDGVTHALTALVRFGTDRRIDLSGQFTDLSEADSAALLALVPDLQQDAGAALTFPQGAISLAADTATIFGLNGQKLELEGKWGDGSVELSKLAAANLGGAKFDLSLALSGKPGAPHIAGDGDISLTAAGGPLLDRLFDSVGTPQSVRTLLARSLPLDLKAHLDDPDNGGGQGLSLSGTAGVADLTLVAKLDGGILGALGGPIDASLDLTGHDAAGLTRQLGLGDVAVLPDGGDMKLTASLKGDPKATLAVSIGLAGGGDSLLLDGHLTPGDLTTVTGDGKLQVALSDTSALAADAGLAGLYTPPVAGSADFRLGADGGVDLDNISATSGATKFTGKLALARDAGGMAATGALTIDRLDVGSLVEAAGSPTALMISAGKLWPDGPIAAGDGPRTTTGDIAIETPSITRGGVPFLSDARFNFGWDTTGVRVRGLAARLAGGEVTLNASLCCAGQLADKELSAETSVLGVPLSAILPPAAAANLSGTLKGSARFSATGDSVEGLLEGLSGDGSFTLDDFSAAKFDPAAFAAVARIEDIVDLDPKVIGDRFAAALNQGPFTSPSLSGGFTVAGGVLRVPNLGAETPAARLFGGATLRLSDLALGGAFALTPVKTLDAAGLVGPTTSRVTANLSGTLPAPVRTLDVADMVDAIKVKALENEVARLEKLKAQDDARAKAAASDRKGATEDASRQALERQQAEAAAAKAAADAAARQAKADADAKAAADAAAKQAAADAAAKQAADDAAAKQAAAKKAQEDAARRAPPLPPPMNLQIPPVQFFEPLN